MIEQGIAAHAEMPSSCMPAACMMPCRSERVYALHIAGSAGTLHDDLDVTEYVQSSHRFHRHAQQACCCISSLRHNLPALLRLQRHACLAVMDA